MAPLRSVTVAVDAMGGDHAPDEIVRGVAPALARGAAHPDAARRRRAQRIGALLARRAPRSRAHRRAPRRPTRCAWTRSPHEALDAQAATARSPSPRSWSPRARADALVSAGNTGASVLACARAWKRIPGVRRARARRGLPDRDPPRREGRSVLAHPRRRRDARRDRRGSGHLRAHGLGLRGAHLEEPAPARGAALERHRGGQGPARDRRGAPPAAREHTELNFVGNVEGVDIPRGTADVVVCSGFVGNVVLKMLEGVSETVVRLGALRLQGAARVARRPDDALGRHQSRSRRSPTGSSTAARRCSASTSCSSRRTAARRRAPIANAVQGRGQGGAGRSRAARSKRRCASFRRSARGRLSMATRDKDGEGQAQADPAGRPVAARGAPPRAAPPPRARLSLGSRQDLSEDRVRHAASDLVRSAFEGAEAKQAVPGASALLRELRAGGARAHLLHLRLAAADAPRAHQEAAASTASSSTSSSSSPTCATCSPAASAPCASRWATSCRRCSPGAPACRRRRARPASATTPRPTASSTRSTPTSSPAASSARCSRRSSQRAGVYDDDAQRAVTLADALPARRRGASASSSTSIAARRPSRFDRYGARAGAGLQLLPGGAGAVRGRAARRAPSVVRVALEMVDRFGYTLDALRNSLQDLLRRGRLRRADRARARRASSPTRAIPQLGALPGGARAAASRSPTRVRELGEVPSIADPPLDDRHRLPGRARGRSAPQGKEAHRHRPARLDQLVEERHQLGRSRST